VALFLQEKMIFLFNESTLYDVRDIAVIHQYCPLEEDITVGDELVIDDHSFKVTFVGHKVNETMRELGHSKIAFTGFLEVDMPGTLELTSFGRAPSQHNILFGHWGISSKKD
jgi:glucitol/sorbitol PTS system EIIA component